MKVAVISATHGRADIVRYAVGKIKEAFKTLKDIEPILVYSYSDHSDGQLLLSLGVIPSYHNNTPLSWKFQTALNTAQDYNPDIVIVIGSDNYFDTNFLKTTIDLLSKYDHTGIKDSYMRQWKTGEHFYFKGYGQERKEPHGTGRAFTKQALNKLSWILWHNPINKGLDREQWVRTKRLTRHSFSVRDNNALMVGLKNHERMHPLELFTDKVSKTPECHKLDQLYKY